MTVLLERGARDGVSLNRQFVSRLVCATSGHEPKMSDDPTLTFNRKPSLWSHTAYILMHASLRGSTWSDWV